MGKRKLGSAHGGGKSEPRRKPSSAQQEEEEEEEEDKRQRRRPTTHHDEEERAATKALARSTRGDDDAAAAASSSSDDDDSDSSYDMDEAEAAAAATAAAEQGFFDESSDSGGEEDSEDDIKLYGEGEEKEGDSSSEDGREEAAAAVKGKKGAKETAGAAGKDAAAKAQLNRGKGKDRGKEKEGVEVSFDFSDPGERFFFGTRALLQWLADEGVETTGLAELIGQEKGLATVVHCTDEDDVFAVATTLNVQAHLTAGDEGMRSLLALVKGKCPLSLQPALDTALASPETYVYLHARFVNLPLPLVPLLHKSGEEDRAWAQKIDPELPRIKTLLTLSPCAVDVGSAASLPYAPNDAIYDRFEDELWVKGAELSYCFPRTAGEEAEGKEKDAKKGQGKKGKGGMSSGGGHASSSLGCVVSLVEGSAVAEALPQIEEMVRTS